MYDLRKDQGIDCGLRPKFGAAHRKVVTLGVYLVCIDRALSI